MFSKITVIVEHAFPDDVYFYDTNTITMRRKFWIKTIAKPWMICPMCNELHVSFPNLLYVRAVSLISRAHHIHGWLRKNNLETSTRAWPLIKQLSNSSWQGCPLQVALPRDGAGVCISSNSRQRHKIRPPIFSRNELCLFSRWGVLLCLLQQFATKAVLRLSPEHNVNACSELATLFNSFITQEGCRKTAV